MYTTVADPDLELRGGGGGLQSFLLFLPKMREGGGGFI